MDQKRTTNAFIGSAIERVEDFRLLRGRGQFVDDLRRPRMLHAAVLRSGVAHGRIRGLDVSAAGAMSGVRTVIMLWFGSTLMTWPSTLDRGVRLTYSHEMRSATDAGPNAAR